MSEQLPLFESQRPDACRLSVSGTFTTETNPDLPGFRLGQLVQFIGSGYITKVTHAHVGKGEVMERQHVLVVDGISFREAPPILPDVAEALTEAMHESGFDGTVTINGTEIQ